MNVINDRRLWKYTCICAYMLMCTHVEKYNEIEQTGCLMCNFLYPYIRQKPNLST